jgi:predicted acylesterase/phospholipase RssA
MKALNKTVKGRKPPKVGLVLSGGSARGIAHVGILSVLEEHHIPIDFIVSTSYGSIVGGYYSYGYSAAELYRMMTEFKLRYVLDLSKPWKKILSVEKTEALFEKDLHGASIESLKIPLSILSADISSGEMVVLEKGSLSKAMLASSSFPGLFEPVSHADRLLIDGGIPNRMLVNIARSKGADIVIFCDVCIFTTLNQSIVARKLYHLLSRHVEKNRERLEHKLHRINIRFIIFKSLCIVHDNQHEHEQFRKSPPDFTISPSVGSIRPLQFRRVNEMYGAGREAALSVVGDIRKEMLNLT